MAGGWQGCQAVPAAQRSTCTAPWLRQRRAVALPLPLLDVSRRADGGMMCNNHSTQALPAGRQPQRARLACRKTTTARTPCLQEDNHSTHALPAGSALCWRRRCAPTAPQTRWTQSCRPAARCPPPLWRCRCLRQGFAQQYTRLCSSTGSGATGVVTKRLCPPARTRCPRSPAFIANPTFAARSAGASLVPSPVTATTSLVKLRTPAMGSSRRRTACLIRRACGAAE